jgi:hypothetical protein
LKETRLGPVPVGVGGETAMLALMPDGEEVGVSPWAFRGAAVPLEVVGRLIADRDYGDDGDLRRELSDAEQIQLNYTLHG